MYRIMTKPVHTRTFKSGNSVAVRLPKGFAIPEGVEVELDKSGDVVTIRLAKNPAAEKARMLKMLDDLAAMPKPPQVEKREPILFPKRRGL
jgi:antitoxin VapB